jgi:hypothetical protein
LCQMLWRMTSENLSIFFVVHLLFFGQTLVHHIWDIEAAWWSCYQTIFTRDQPTWVGLVSVLCACSICQHIMVHLHWTRHAS